MKRVRCLRGESSLTYGKIYDVIREYTIGTTHLFDIQNDNKLVYGYIMNNHFGDILFEDATIEIRNEIIDGILS